MIQSIQAIGDTALRVEWPGDVSLKLNDTIIRFCSNLKKHSVPGVVEWVPAYKTVTVYYAPHIITYEELLKEIQYVLQMNESRTKWHKEQRIISVPVYYGGDAGPELDRVAQLNNISVEQVVKRHQKSLYVVYMLGFLPGFPYLGGLDRSIATPRLETVRQKTPKGSVGIAHYQTGIYPSRSPGGWNIIGQTPLTLMDSTKQHPFLFQAGDKVQFYEVTYKEFTTIEQEVNMGMYNVDIHIEYNKASE